MSFVDEVNRIKDGVLSKPEYREPINSVINRANAYTSELKLDKQLSRSEEEEQEK